MSSKPKRMRLMAAKKAGFVPKVLRSRKELQGQTIGYLKQRSSFLVAAFSLVAFITGNLVGQHGLYAFMKAALGQYDDSLITYTGTVTPLALVPDFEKWSQYGGGGEEHTFRQVPKDVLIPMPRYDSRVEKGGFESGGSHGDIYSIGHMGSYETGAEGDGSHIGVDIRTPVGTPVRSIANGIVTRVDNDKYGFGLLIVIRHPHMPNPDNPEYETVLHSGYAHLSAQYVKVGDIVQKGQEIGLTGKTGFATGPHLHFQIDRDTAPWHPYWAFSASEAKEANLTTSQAINKGLHRERGYEFTVNPVLYAQTNYPAAKYADPGTSVVKKKTGTTVTRASSSRRGAASAQTLADARAKRLAARMATRSSTAVVAAASSSSAAGATVVQTDTVAATKPTPSSAAPVLVVPKTGTVAGVEIEHDRKFEGRTWETIRIILLDINGSRVSADGLTKDLYMRTAYGEAEFDPPVLSALDFKDGVAEVKMLPRGTRTVVIQVQPFQTISGPMEYNGN